MSTPLSASANQFAVDLFQCYLRRHGDKYRNLLLCPYVIYHSLAMMLVGAKGTTAEQLKKLLRIPKVHEGSTSSSSGSSSPSPSSSLNIERQQQLKSCRSSGSSSFRSSSASTTGSSLGSNSTNSSIALPTPMNGARSKSKSTSRRSSTSPSASPSSSSSRKARARSKSPTSRLSRSRIKSRAIAEKSLVGVSSKQLTPDGSNESRHRQFLLLTEQLIHGNHEFVHIASFIYLDKGAKRVERYKNLLRDYYETKPKKIDFDNLELMVKTVNEDVARTTENIYNDILSKQEAQKLEKSLMFLVNAVFFRPFWLSNFTDVKQAPFFKWTNAKSAQEDAKPQQYNVNMMSKLDYLPVVMDDQLDARIVKMPFEASDLQMLLILPNNQQSDSNYLCDKISAVKINQIVEQFSKAKCKTVRISMPIFCIDSGKISIQSTLVTMGAGELFDEKKADLSGVCENKHIWLNKILHRCFIILDNRGSITSSSFEKAKRRQAKLESISSGRSGVDEFKADHPFMYIIMDSVTKTILLIGLYTDPSETLEVIHENQLSPEEAHQIYTEGVYKT